MAVTVVHPGEHLAEELEALDMSAAELARKLGVPPIASRRFCMAHARSQATPLCAALISLAPARSFGSISKIFMT